MIVSLQIDMQSSPQLNALLNQRLPCPIEGLRQGDTLIAQNDNHLLAGESVMVYWDGDKIQTEKPDLIWTQTELEWEIENGWWKIEPAPIADFAPQMPIRIWKHSDAPVEYKFTQGTDRDYVMNVPLGIDTVEVLRSISSFIDSQFKTSIEPDESVTYLFSM